MSTCKACEGTGRRMSSNKAGDEYLMLCNECNISEEQFEEMRTRDLAQSRMMEEFFGDPAPTGKANRTNWRNAKDTVAFLEHAHYGDKH